MTKKKNEVAESKGTEVSTNVSGGIAGEFDKSDIQQGRLAVMQSGSNLVKEEKARQGAVVNLVDGEEVAYKGNKDEEAKPLLFTICGIMKYWIEKDKDSEEFIAKYPAANQNEKEWEEVVNGKTIQRTFHFSYVVLLVDEMKDGIEMPYELAFRSTAVKETKKLNTLIDRLAKKGISSSNKVFKGTVMEDSNDKHKWFKLDLGIERDATEEERATTEQYLADFVKTKEKFMSQQEDGFAKAETTTANASTDEY